MMIKQSMSDHCNWFDDEDSSLFDFSVSGYKSEKKGTCHPSCNTCMYKPPKRREKKKEREPEMKMQDFPLS